MHDSRAALLPQRKEGSSTRYVLLTIALIVGTLTLAFNRLNREDAVGEVEASLGGEAEEKARRGRFDALAAGTVNCFDSGYAAVINDECPACNGKADKACFTGEAPQRIKRGVEEASFFRDDGVCRQIDGKWMCAQENYQPPSTRTPYPKWDADPKFELECEGGTSQEIYEKFIDAAYAECENFFTPTVIAPEKRDYTKIKKYFQDFGTACKKGLESGAKPAFWSGDIALSRFAREGKNGYTTLEGTALGALMDVKLSFDLLGGRGDGCIGKFWTAISAQFTTSMSADTVTVLLGAMRQSSTYFKTELGRTMNNPALKKTKFKFTKNECKCPRPRDEEKCISTHVQKTENCDFLKGTDGKDLEVTCDHPASGSEADKSKAINDCLAAFLCKTPKYYVEARFSVDSPTTLQPSQRYVDPGNSVTGDVYYDNFDDKGATTIKVWGELCTGKTADTGQELPAVGDQLYNQKTGAAKAAEFTALN